MGGGNGCLDKRQSSWAHFPSLLSQIPTGCAEAAGGGGGRTNWFFLRDDFFASPNGPPRPPTGGPLGAHRWAATDTDWTPTGWAQPRAQPPARRVTERAPRLSGQGPGWRVGAESTECGPSEEPHSVLIGRAQPPAPLPTVPRMLFVVTLPRESKSQREYYNAEFTPKYTPKYTGGVVHKEVAILGPRNRLMGFFMKMFWVKSVLQCKSEYAK